MLNATENTGPTQNITNFTCVFLNIKHNNVNIKLNSNGTFVTLFQFLPVIKMFI